MEMPLREFRPKYIFNMHIRPQTCFDMEKLGVKAELLF